MIDLINLQHNIVKRLFPVRTLATMNMEWTVQRLLNWLQETHPSFWITLDASTLNNTVPRQFSYAGIMSIAILVEIINEVLGEEILYVYVKYDIRSNLRETSFIQALIMEYEK